MKFGKRLKQQIDETLPEWRDKFLSYKHLKKLVRLISLADNPSSQLAAEGHFLRCLDAEIDKFNSFFVEQEEDFIIRQKLLKERIQNAVDGGVMGRIQKDIVNFHGEMVLLENYSSINYTGLAKILKKFDKRTGGLLRMPFIEKVLKQPFFTTEILTKLVEDCELMMEMVFIGGPIEERGAIAATAGREIFRNTVVALETMHELRKGSSTYGHFSLPPLSLPDVDLLQSLKFPSPIPIQ